MHLESAFAFTLNPELLSQASKHFQARGKQCGLRFTVVQRALSTARKVIQINKKKC